MQPLLSLLCLSLVSCALATDPISLLWATGHTNLVFNDSQPSTPPRTFFSMVGEISTLMLSADQQVVVHYASGNDTFVDVEASFHHSQPGGFAVYIFKIDNFHPGSCIRVNPVAIHCDPLLIEFALKLSAKGQEYWDTNGGKDYRLVAPGYDTDIFDPETPAPQTVIGPSEVGTRVNSAGYFGYMHTITGLLSVRPCAVGTAKVAVRTTTDSWMTFSETPASFDRKTDPKDPNQEQWRFRVYLQRAFKPVYFKVLYACVGQMFADLRFVNWPMGPGDSFSNLQQTHVQ